MEDSLPKQVGSPSNRVGASTRMDKVAATGAAAVASTHNTSEEDAFAAAAVQSGRRNDFLQQRRSCRSSFQRQSYMRSRMDFGSNSPSALSQNQHSDSHHQDEDGLGLLRATSRINFEPHEVPRRHIVKLRSQEFRD